MKWSKVPMYATILLSVALLTACGDGKEVDKEVDKEPESEVASNPLSNVNSGQAGSSGGGSGNRDNIGKGSSASVNSNAPVLASGYMVVGSDLNGYIQVPETFVKFIDVNNSESTGYQAHSAPDSSIIVTQQNFGDVSTYNTILESVATTLNGMGGDFVEMEPTEINGLKAMYYHTYFSANDLDLNLYVIAGAESIKYISIEYSGDKSAIRDSIIAGFSETDYSGGQVSSQASQDNSGVVSNNSEGVTNNQSTSVQNNQSQVVSNTSDSLILGNVTSNSISYKVYGDFVVGQEYFNSFTSTYTSGIFGSSRVKAEQDANGAYVQVTIDVKGTINSGKYNISISNASTNPTEFFQKHDITIE